MGHGRHSAGADHVVNSTGSSEQHSGGLNLVDIAQPSHRSNGGEAHVTQHAGGQGSVHRVADTDAPAGPANRVVEKDAPAGTATGGKGDDHVVITPLRDGYSLWGPTDGDQSHDKGDKGDKGDGKPVSASWSDKQKEVTDAIDKVVESGAISKPIKDVQVVYQDYDGEKPDPKQKTPDIVVQKDGTVIVNSNPERKPDDPLIVQVERDKGQTGAPSEEQQKAVDGVVKYLADNYMEKKPDGHLDGKITDDQGLVSDKTKQSIAPDVVPSDLPPAARQQTEAVNRWHGSGGGRNGGSDGGSLSPSQQSDVIPPRDVPRQADESDKLAAMKDVVAGFAAHGDKDPYHHVEARGDRGFAVGRYGATSDQISGFCDWLSGLSEEQIEELIKKGVLPKNIKQFMEKMKSKEGQAFLDKLHDGKEAPGKEEIDGFFDKETQEAAGSYNVTKMAGATANEDGTHNIGKLALGMQLGRVPTEEDLKNPDYQKMMQAAEKAYPVSLQHVLDGTANIDLSDKAKAIAAVAKADVGKALWTDYAAQTENGNLGCAASVSSALRQAGAVPPGFNELSVYGLDTKLQGAHWQEVDFAHRQPGDVIIAYRTSDPAGSSGGGAHTGIVGEGGATYSNSSNSGQWSYNSPDSWIPPNGGYVQVHVLRAPGAAA
jgi:hypothetical protein